jgi:hypothetical protein
MSEIATPIRSTVDGDGAVILDIERNQIVTLNTTGGFVWERLKRGESVDMIVQELAQATETDPHVVEQDVRAFLCQLAEKRLLGK